MPPSPLPIIDYHSADCPTKIISQQACGPTIHPGESVHTN